MKIISIFSGIVLAALVVSGCGGGGGGGGAGSGGAAGFASSEPRAEGLWIGTTATDRTVTGLVFRDGSYYVLYSPVGDPNTIAGVVEGTGVATTSTYSSSNARDFNVEGLGVSSATVTVNYKAKDSFNGTIAYESGDSTTFVTTYDSDFETVPSLATFAGTYTGQVALSVGVQSATVSITSTGQISGDGEGCQFTGAATPHPDGNAFKLSIAFGPSPCFFASQTLTGVAYYDAVSKRVYVVAPDATRTDGVLFVGEKI